MKGDRLGSHLGVRRRPAVRLLDHQVDVKRLVGDLANGFDDREPQREVGYEVVVHYVDVYRV